MIRFPRLFILFLCCLGAFSALFPASDPLQLRPKTYTSFSGKEVQAEVGEIMVPENRNNSESEQIAVTFIRLKTTAKQPLSPVFYLEGGPGSAATFNAENPHVLENWLPLLERADLILINQRGTGPASRRLTYIDFAGPSADFWTSEVAFNQQYCKMAKAAADHWSKNGIDVAGYNTVESAKDLEVLRQALELPKISLLGFSYGTHLGQAYLKEFDAFVDRAVLVGVEGLGETLKEPLALDRHFKMIAGLVAADSTVNTLVPDLVALYQQVAKQLTDTPAELTVTDPLSGNPMTVRAGKIALDYILFMDLGDASDLPVIPRLLYEMNQGDYRAFQWFLNKRITNGYGIHAMAMATDLASGASPARVERVKKERKESMFGGVVVTPYLDIKKVWPVTPLGDDFRVPLTTEVPTLIMSGTLDRNTPVEQGQRLADQLPNAIHLIVQHAGHEQILPAKDAVSTVTRFLAGESVANTLLSYRELKFLPVAGPVPADAHPAVSNRE